MDADPKDDEQALVAVEPRNTKDMEVHKLREEQLKKVPEAASNAE
jgi:hypothetical protein